MCDIKSISDVDSDRICSGVVSWWGGGWAEESGRDNGIIYMQNELRFRH